MCGMGRAGCEPSGGEKQKGKRSRRGRWEKGYEKRGEGDRKGRRGDVKRVWRGSGAGVKGSEGEGSKGGRAEGGCV